MPITLSSPYLLFGSSESRPTATPMKTMYLQYYSTYKFHRFAFMSRSNLRTPKHQLIIRPFQVIFLFHDRKKQKGKQNAHWKPK